MPTAGFVVIGNEILSGKVVDTNSPFLAKELRKIGVDLERILTIPDDIDTIAREVRKMSDTHDHVMTSGGIGPTHDDLTMDGVAKAFDLPMVLDEELCARIEQATGDHFNESMRKMAILPKGASVQESGDLWFPLISVENVFILPGIPRLFEAKFESIKEQLTHGVPFALKRVYVKSYESEIASQLHELLDEFSELALGSYPRMGDRDFRVLLTLESRDTDYLERALQSLLSRLPADIVHRVE
ncbi:MAG: competence/damage-inducible protein A [bacterium]|nr:competence/damage-inducible protein A [bacterium]